MRITSGSKIHNKYARNISFSPWQRSPLGPIPQSMWSLNYIWEDPDKVSSVQSALNKTRNIKYTNTNHVPQCCLIQPFRQGSRRRYPEYTPPPAVASIQPHSRAPPVTTWGWWMQTRSYRLACNTGWSALFLRCHIQGRLENVAEHLSYAGDPWRLVYSQISSLTNR